MENRNIAVDSTISIAELLDLLKTGFCLTESFFESYPFLLKNKDLLNCIFEFDIFMVKRIPNFTEEVIECTIFNCLLQGQLELLFALPIFDRENSKFYQQLQEIVNSLFIPNGTLDESRHYSYFDCILDGLIRLSYEDEKKKLDFKTVNDIDCFINDCFSRLPAYMDDQKLVAFVVDSIIEAACLHDFLKKITRSVEELLIEYKKTGRLGINSSTATTFYNFILNEQMNDFAKKTKQSLISNFKTKASIHPKKKQLIQRGFKLERITTFIQTDQFDKLGTTHDAFFQKIDETEKMIRVKKKKTTLLSDAEFLALKQQFTTGEWTFASILSILPKSDFGFIKYIFRKYQQIKLSYLEHVSLNNQGMLEIEKPELGFHYKNYLFSDRRRSCTVITKLIMLLRKNPDVINDFYQSKPYYCDIKELLLFSDFVDSFSIDDCIEVLKYYHQFYKTIDYSDTDCFIYLIKHFDEVLSFSLGYKKYNDKIGLVLGDQVLSVVKKHRAEKYFNMYLKTFFRRKGLIPPITGELTDNTIYLSGNYQDVDRLIMGIIVLSNSCVDLFYGDDFDSLDPKEWSPYEIFLLSTHGDVLFLKDKSTGEVLGRSFLYRKGAVIVMSAFRMKGKVPHKKSLIYNQLPIIEKIASQIIDQTLARGDKIDYFLFSSNYDYRLNAPCYSGGDIESLFFHCDFGRYTYVVDGNKSDQPVSMNKFRKGSKEKIRHAYPQIRNSIKYGDTVSSKELSRFIALYGYLQPVKEIRDYMLQQYNPIFIEDYHYVVLGHDWLILVHKDGLIEELCFPTIDERGLMELESERNKLFASNIDDRFVEQDGKRPFQKYPNNS